MFRRGSRHTKRESIGLTERETIVIATEGEKTEPDYLTYLQRKYRMVIIKFIPRDYSCSDPMQVLEDLIDFKNQESSRWGKVKEHWIVIDIDGRCSDVMDAVIRKADLNGLRVADSNPSFELWLLLHRKALSDYEAEEVKKLHMNERIGDRTRLELELIKVCGEYNKSDIRDSDYLPYVTTAIKNAYNEDTKPRSLWMHQIGTRVYRLAQSIKDS